MAVAPDGSRVARVDPAQPRRAILYPMSGGTGVPLPVQPLAIAVMVFSPDGNELAVGSESGSLNVYRTSDGAPVQSFTGHAGALHGIAWTGTAASTGLYTIGLDGQLVSWDLSSGPRTIGQSGSDRIVPNRAERFGPLVIGDTQPPNTPNSRRLLYTIDVRTGTYSSWPAGLRDDEGIGQAVSSINARRALVSITGISGQDAGQNRIEIFDLRTHHDVGHLALPTGTAYSVDGLAAAISPDASLRTHRSAGSGSASSRCRQAATCAASACITPTRTAAESRSSPGSSIPLDGWCWAATTPGRTVHPGPSPTQP